MVVTEPDNPPYQRQSMIIVPTDTPGVNIVRNVGHSFGGEPGRGTHAYIRYEDVRVPKDNLLGGRGNAFVVAQTRLGGGRIHHAMRTVGMAQRALDMMLERAVSRRTQGELLSKKQLVQEMVADSWIDLEQFRLLVLRTAWRIDRYQDYKRVRGDISAVKVAMPGVLHRIASRALQVHGSLGITEEMPFMDMIANAYHLGLADGPTEVHKVTLARTLLADVEPGRGPVPDARTSPPPANGRAGQVRGRPRPGRGVTEAAAVRASDQLDWVALEARLRGALDVPAAPMEVRQFTAGRANLTYLVTFGDAPLVVRRPPRGTIAPGAHDMAREHRVLSRLTDRYPRAPRALYFDDDESVIGAPFVVIEYREGVIVSAEIPPSLARHSDAATRIDLALLDAAADLHAVDAAAAGLGDLGRPDGLRPAPARRLAQPVAPGGAGGRARVDGSSGRSGWLHRCPSRNGTALVHNDLKLDNCQLQPDDPDRSRRCSTGTWRRSGIRCSTSACCSSRCGRCRLGCCRPTKRSGTTPSDPGSTSTASAGTGHSPRGARRSCCSSSTTATWPGSRPTSATPGSARRSRTAPSAPARWSPDEALAALMS